MSRALLSPIFQTVKRSFLVQLFLQTVVIVFQQECAKEKSKPEDIGESIKEDVSTSKVSVGQNEERDSELESTESSNDLKEKESNF